MPSQSALIVVDVQRDFCAGGALAASDTASLVGLLTEAVEKARSSGAAIVFTRDWHPPDHSSFRSGGGPWPVHCVAGSPGAQFMPPLQVREADTVISKGTAREGPGYSGFESTELAAKLRKLGTRRVAVSGIATEYCVRATALDAVRAGFETVVLTDLIRPVDARETERVLAELKTAGVEVTTAADWLTSSGRRD